MEMIEDDQARRVLGELDDSAFWGEDNIDTSELDDLVLDKDWWGLQEKSVFLVDVVNELNSLLVFQNLFGLEQLVNFVADIFVVGSGQIVSGWLLQLRPPGNVLDGVLGEEVE